MKKIILQALISVTAILGSAAQTTVSSTDVSLPDFDENNVNVITEQPKGEIRYYNRSGFEVTMTNDGVQITNQSGVMTVVFGSDNEVWILNPISNDIRSSWIKGQIDTDKTTISVATGQFTDYMQSMTFGRQLWVLDFDQTTGLYTVNTDITEIKYSIKDGVISLDGTTRQQIIGNIYRAKGDIEEEHHYEGGWDGYGNYESVYTPYPDMACTVPSDASPETFTFRAPVYNYGQWSSNVLEATLSIVNDDEIYLSGITSSGPYFTNMNWTIKGRRQGDRLIFPSKQFLGTYYDNPYYIIGSTSGSNESCDIIFNLTQEGLYETDNIINYTSSPSGDNIYFYYDGATLSQLPLPELVTPPASARQHLFKMAYKGYIQSIDFYYDSSANVTVAATDDKVYIKGLYYGVPNAWVEGDIIGDKAVFYSTQYLGFLNEMNPELWFMAFGDEFDKPLDRIEFDYDKNTGSLSNASANISITRCERRNLGLQWFFKPSLEVIEINPAVPANPQDLEWISYEWDQNATFAFEIPTKDTEGESLVENWLCYRIYVDTEDGESVFSMTPETYPDMKLTEPIDLFPYNYMGFDLSYTYGRHYITMRDDWSTYKRIGVESIYDAGGVENHSEIIWIDLGTTGIENVSVDPAISDNRIYNLNGQPVKGTPTPGIYICNGKKIVIR